MTDTGDDRDPDKITWIVAGPTYITYRIGTDRITITGPDKAWKPGEIRELVFALTTAQRYADEINGNGSRITFDRPRPIPEDLPF